MPETKIVTSEQVNRYKPQTHRMKSNEYSEKNHVVHFSIVNFGIKSNNSYKDKPSREYRKNNKI